MNQDDNTNRPAVLNNLTDTQMQELQQEFEEQDRNGWKNRTESYGWSEQDSQAVWNWFGLRPQNRR